MSALIEVGEFPRRYAMRVLVHSNPFFYVGPNSSNYDERPVSSVYSTAFPESLRVMRDVNIEVVYIAG